MAKKKQGLGKGLDALMQNSADDFSENDFSSDDRSEKKTGKKNAAFQNENLPSQIQADENGTLWLDPAILKPNPHQPRKNFDEASLEELAASIRENGIVQPVVIESAEDGTFFVIAGERRTRAAILAGQKKIPVQIRKLSEQKKLEVALIENIQRADLNPIEEAKAYFNLMQIGGLNQDEVAKKVGKGRPTVANALRLLKLPEDMQNSLALGEISSGHARALLSVLNAADQRTLFKKIVNASLSVRQAENLASDLNAEVKKKKSKSKSKSEKKDANIAAIEERFVEVFGTKVQLKGTLEKGALVVEYFSREDLDRLYEIIAGKN